MPAGKTLCSSAQEIKSGTGALGLAECQRSSEVLTASLQAGLVLCREALVCLPPPPFSRGVGPHKLPAQPRQTLQLVRVHRGRYSKTLQED